ncbi:hypothetical protein M422DRAFT_780067 [Sphaerobolus stellatus SS14]|uniref:Uncharacterized protein n=1 Tax=Sphaerobolus stellatus (strain SS14) TaxID=990650 RepID=A0A0C9V5R9_SPHS4|nr:hypothetical protein M422DRAFT_780067 [Sphaerobolus stellatus SS14]
MPPRVTKKNPNGLAPPRTTRASSKRDVVDHVSADDQPGEDTTTVTRRSSKPTVQGYRKNSAQKAAEEKELQAKGAEEARGAAKTLELLNITRDPPGQPLRGILKKPGSTVGFTGIEEEIEDFDEEAAEDLSGSTSNGGNNGSKGTAAVPVTPRKGLSGSFPHSSPSLPPTPKVIWKASGTRSVSFSIIDPTGQHQSSLVQVRIPIYKRAVSGNNGYVALTLETLQSIVEINPSFMAREGDVSRVEGKGLQIQMGCGKKIVKDSDNVKEQRMRQAQFIPLEWDQAIGLCGTFAWATIAMDKLITSSITTQPMPTAQRPAMATQPVVTQLVSDIVPEVHPQDSNLHQPIQSVGEQSSPPQCEPSEADAVDVDMSSFNGFASDTYDDFSSFAGFASDPYDGTGMTIEPQGDVVVASAPVEDDPWLMVPAATPGTSAATAPLPCATPGASLVEWLRVAFDVQLPASGATNAMVAIVRARAIRGLCLAMETRGWSTASGPRKWSYVVKEEGPFKGQLVNKQVLSLIVNVGRSTFDSDRNLLDRAEQRKDIWLQGDTTGVLKDHYGDLGPSKLESILKKGETVAEPHPVIIASAHNRKAAAHHHIEQSSKKLKHANAPGPKKKLKTKHDQKQDRVQRMNKTRRLEAEEVNNEEEEEEEETVVNINGKRRRVVILDSDVGEELDSSDLDAQ